MLLSNAHRQDKEGLFSYLIIITKFNFQRIITQLKGHSLEIGETIVQCTEYDYGQANVLQFNLLETHLNLDDNVRG